MLTNHGVHSLNDYNPTMVSVQRQMSDQFRLEVLTIQTQLNHSEQMSEPFRQTSARETNSLNH
ncbi:hypothetical protein Hanom_Chr10g00891921 [Helianthus anomalus]